MARTIQPQLFLAHTALSPILMSHMLEIIRPPSPTKGKASLFKAQNMAPCQQVTPAPDIPPELERQFKRMEWLVYRLRRAYLDGIPSQPVQALASAGAQVPCLDTHGCRVPHAMHLTCSSVVRIPAAVVQQMKPSLARDRRAPCGQGKDAKSV